MNKTFSLARTAECIPASSVADSARPELGSVLRARIYGLFNGGRLQIRRAVNQPSSRPPHRAQCTVGIVGGVDRPIKYWVHALPRLRATSPEGRERESGHFFAYHSSVVLLRGERTARISMRTKLEDKASLLRRRKNNE